MGTPISVDFLRRLGKFILQNAVPLLKNALILHISDKYYVIYIK